MEGTEEKLRNRESRPEDLHVIAELREMVTEREALVKKLVVSRRGGPDLGMGESLRSKVKNRHAEKV